MNDLDKIINPKSFLILLSVPFMCICPAFFLSLVTGFPFSQLQNNQRIINYENTFEILSLPEDTTQIGRTYTKMGGFDTREKYEFDRCDFVSAKLIKSSTERENLSQLLLDEYQEEFGNNVKDLEHSELISGSTIKLMPVSTEDNVLEEDGFELRVPKDFGVSEINLEEDESLYIVYLVNYNVLESRDGRCNSEIRENRPEPPTNENNESIDENVDTNSEDSEIESNPDEVVNEEGEAENPVQDNSAEE